MSKDDALKRQLSALNAAAADPHAAASSEELRKALAGRSSHAAARAAAIAGEYGLFDLIPDLVAAFGRLLPGGAAADPGCSAKTAIAAALLALEASEGELFLSGVHTVQKEPVYGGQEDTAAQLRALCASGLALSGYEDTLIELAHLLVDPEPDARIGAARAVARAAQPGGLPLLWLKALSGDSETPVMLEVFAVLLDLAPRKALPLVAAHLSSANGPLAEAAALALGESRLPEALPPLESALAAPDPSLRRAVMTAMAVLRTDAAIDRLIAAVRDGNGWERRDALAALEMVRHDERIWSRVEKALDG